MGELVGDIRYAFRQINNRKLFSCAVIFVVALAMGANAMLFSCVNGLLLKKLPVRDPANLFELMKKQPMQVRPDENFSYSEYQVLNRNALGFLHSVDAECQLGLQPITIGDQPQLIPMSAVSALFFKNLGLSPERGRFFYTNDNTNNGSAPAILSYRFWKGQRDAGIDVFGKTIHIRGYPFTVAGVLPRDFHGLNLDSQPDVVVPLSALQLIAMYPVQAAQFSLYVRLREGITPTVAAELSEPLLKQGIEESVRAYAPAGSSPNLKGRLEFKASLLPLEHGVSQVRGLFSKAVLLLMGGSVVLLLIACLNVGGLLLTRSHLRGKEFAIRRSLGATTVQLVRQLLTEAFLLAVLGSLAGFGLAYASIPVVLRLVPYLRNPATQVLITPAIDLGPDWRVLLFISVGCLVSGMLFGVAPAITALRFDLNHELKQFYGSTLRATRVGPILVCLQMVLSVVLTSTSISMVHSYWNLLHTNTGFDDDHIITFRISPAAGGYQDQQLRGYYERLLQQVRGLSQIRNASLVSYGVMRGKGFGAIITPTHSAMSGGASFQVSWNLVSPGYFETMGMHILEGRDLRPDEGKDERPPFPVVVDEQFAHMVFSNQDVIGRTFAQGTSGSAPPVYHVIGLVTNAKYRSLRDTLSPTFYVQPIWTDRAVGVLNLYVRTSGDPRSLVTHIRQAIRATDPNVPIIEITTLKMEEQNSVWQERVLLIVTIFFGIAGLVLANIGLYGLLAQYVVQQKRNIGIRMALGARTSHIVGAVCFSSMITVLIGLCCGVLLGRVALHFIDTFLYGVTSSDPLSYVVSVALILSTTLLAALTPTLQAIRLHPASVLRID